MIKRKLKWIWTTSSIMLITLLIGFPIGADIMMAESSNNEREWGFSQAIELSGEGPYHALFLDEAVYGATSDDLSDLRVVDHEGKFVPYYLDSGYDESKDQSTTYSSTLIRTALKDGNTLLDYKVTPLLENTDIQGNILAIELPKEDFLKHVKVYGSYDGNQWEFIEQSDLYRTDQVVKSNIELASANKYEFYRLNVLDNVEKLTFQGLQLIHNTEDLQWLEYKKKGEPAYEVKQEAGFTEIIVHNENRLRLKRMEIQVGDKHFTRTYKLYDDQGVNIRTVGEQDVYQLDFKDVQITNNTITAPEPIRSPYFTIKINNRDDSPLGIVGVSTEYIVDKLVFEDRGAGPYRLLYGNIDATRPQYDIVNFKTHIEQEDVALGQLGEQVSISEVASKEGPTAWWQQQKMWFNGMIIVVSLVLIVLLVKKMNPTNKG